MKSTYISCCGKQVALTTMFKFLFFLCFAVSALQAVPTQNKNNDESAEVIASALQRILELLERIDLPVIGDLVDIGAPLYKIKEAIEAILASADNEESLSCLEDSIEEIGNDVVVKLVEDFEKLLSLILERQAKIEACFELPIGVAACRTSVQITYSILIIQAATEVTNGLENIPDELREKVMDCIIEGSLSRSA